MAAETTRRRRRPAVSCSLCRRRKVRCNREQPCNNCLRSKNVSCVYEDNPPLRSRQHHPQISRPNNDGPKSDSSAAAEASAMNAFHFRTGASTTISSPSLSDPQPPSNIQASLHMRIKHLEEQLSRQNIAESQNDYPTPSTSVETMTLGVEPNGQFDFLHESDKSGLQTSIVRNVSHKTRFFGQSHWITSIALFQNIATACARYLSDGSSPASLNLHRCKALGKIIKARMVPSWPALLSLELPEKQLADELVERYLRTLESVYRVLHIPSFRREYDALWTSTSPPDTSFLVQLKLVLAIGATTYDSKFSLRKSVNRWIFEAQTYLSEPEFKSRLGLQHLQSNILLLIARETAGIGADITWTSAGALYRTAVYMGLHRDPTKVTKCGVYASEMRRRLWNTILEVCIQSSLTSGGPPSISITEFDTEPPSNFDDEQLLASNPIAKPADELTQSSITIALRKSVPIRLKILQNLNNLGMQSTYEEMLCLDSELRTVYKQLCHTLAKLPTSRFDVQLIELIMNRYISVLHIPFLSAGTQSPVYAFSRKVVFETSLKLWQMISPTSTFGQSTPSTEEPCDGDIQRLVIIGHGFYRHVSTQAMLMLAIELRSQLEESISLGPNLLRPDLRAIVEEGKSWMLKSVEAGETNVKGHLLMCVAIAQIDALASRLGEEEAAKMMIKAAEDSETVCMEVLQRIIADIEREEGSEGYGEQGLDAANDMALPDPMSLNAPLNPMDDWEFLMSDVVLNASNAEPTQWMFADGTMQTAAINTMF
ncbi:hypothetical protein BS50DRAFT_53841 [Corynespora cassiicola Philippines]|uniref:Zn(2)-C6 fungal-type domain-containing protein n=1 Tax=Corynespora cassiicola Philippines TaxID=1448308 RepID=A0A2T2NIQ5_CORCC|nr:hypothetical protein BS50DRAFT_53841 [Corynespora cassiicola Philippines]